jgi:hypothetical protein
MKKFSSSFRYLFRFHSIDNDVNTRYFNMNYIDSIIKKQQARTEVDLIVNPLNYIV